MSAKTPSPAAKPFRRGLKMTDLLNYGKPESFGRAVAVALATTGLTEAEYVLMAQKFEIKGIKRFKAYRKFYEKEGYDIVELENGRFVENQEQSSFAGSLASKDSLTPDPTIAERENVISINRMGIEKLFSIEDIVRSGGGKKSFRITEILDDRMRIQPTEASNGTRLHYQKISAVINNIHIIDPNHIEKSVYDLLLKCGLKDTQNESYLYGFAKEFLARFQSKQAPAIQAPEVIPEELTNSERLFEGAKKTITVNVYERDPRARLACISYWGHSCVICGFDFFAVYGQLGEGFIHVHHLTPIASIGTQYELDPIADLRPVCPNCHAMLHRTVPTKEIDEIMAILKV